MPGRGNGAKQKGRSRKVAWRHLPADSISNPDPTFFQSADLSMASSHSQSKTWKSNEAKERDQFSRVKNLVYHFVPDSPFPPQTLAEWMDHRAAIQEDAKKAMVKSIEVKQAMKSANSRLPFKSAFAADSEHPLNDSRSSVLSLPSIWSTTYTPTFDRPDASWPERAEMQHEGEDRAGGDGGKTNFGRFLPLPRVPGNETAKWSLRAAVEPLSMIDTTCIKPDALDEDGKRIGLPEILTQNMIMDCDEEFWHQGEHFLGKNLLEEL